MESFHITLRKSSDKGQTGQTDSSVFQEINEATAQGRKEISELGDSIIQNCDARIKELDDEEVTDEGVKEEQ